VLDMKEVDLFDQLPDLFEQIRPGLWKVKRPRRPRRLEEGPSRCLDLCSMHGWAHEASC
jgi:hypothetical protein